MFHFSITGSVNITDLQLSPAAPAPILARTRQLFDSTISKLSQLSVPVLTEMFNAFFSQYAQFPIPLVDGYACQSPELRWFQRTMQVDTDVRVLPEETRRGKTKTK